MGDHDLNAEALEAAARALKSGSYPDGFRVGGMYSEEVKAKWRRDRAELLAPVIRAYLSALPPPWKPIESAPRDGQSILVYGAAHDAHHRAFAKDVHVAWWSQEDEWWAPQSCALYTEPTHWMPLPAPPTPDPITTHDCNAFDVEMGEGDRDAAKVEWRRRQILRFAGVATAGHVEDSQSEGSGHE